MSPGPSSTGTPRLTQGVGGCQPWGHQPGPDLRPLASVAMHTGCSVLWSRAPGGGLMETPLHWDPRREKESNVHPKHFSAARPDSHVSDGRLPHQKLAGRVLKWLVAVLTDPSPPPRTSRPVTAACPVPPVILWRRRQVPTGRWCPDPSLPGTSGQAEDSHPQPSPDSHLATGPIPESHQCPRGLFSLAGGWDPNTIPSAECQKVNLGRPQGGGKTRPDGVTGAPGSSQAWGPRTPVTGFPGTTAKRGVFQLIVSLLEWPEQRHGEQRGTSKETAHCLHIISLE